jgi:metallo-beta-lactamase class B
MLISAAILLPGCSNPEGQRDTAAKLATIPSWLQDAAPCHVAGPIFFVGRKGLGVWLVETEAGGILINTGFNGSAGPIKASLHELGKNPANIRYLLACHAHSDHVGGHAELAREFPNMQICMMEDEVKVLRSGGLRDIGASKAVSWFLPVRGEIRPLHHEEKITLGGVTVQALRTPGHTRGSTTFVMEFLRDGRPCTVVFPDGTGMNFWYKLVCDASYEGIARTYRKTFVELGRLQPDIWLAPHLEACGFATTRDKTTRKGLAIAGAWQRRAAYHDFLENEKTLFEAALAKAMQKCRERHGGRCIVEQRLEAGGS